MFHSMDSRAPRIAAVFVCLPWLVQQASPALWLWLPTLSEFWDMLQPHLEYDSVPAEVQKLPEIDTLKVTRWTAEHWWVAKLVCVAYLASIWLLKRVMDGRKPIYATVLVTLWNITLCVFSVCGLWSTGPKLLELIQTRGLRGSVCVEPWAYGYGASGLWTAAFIFSKPFEMVDTLFLLLRGRPVIFLHWYHHATVMLFCWHAYASRVGGAGLWFAAMNYFVHSLMYFYFASQTQRMFPGFRSAIKVWTSPVLTLLQITQMVVGLAVLVDGVRALMAGHTCYLPKITAILGIGMYSSYFVLFVKLFVDHYIFGKRAG